MSAAADFVAWSPVDKPHVRYHADFDQGSLQWLEARRGLLTASEMKLILSPTLKLASNDKTRAHVWEIAAQRITGHVEPHYISDDMLRGHEDEVRARLAYGEKFGEVTECGFVTSSKWGFTIGYSPDALVGDEGLIEAKSRRQKYQVQTIIKGVPDEHVLQLQTGLLVTEREWIDYVSYCGGMPMTVFRVERDEEVQAAIVTAAANFERLVSDAVADFHSALASDRLRWLPTERVIEQEMF